MPQIFAISAATVISYFLVILIFITPRTFFVGGPGGGAGFLTRRGLSGNSSVVGVGRRPLLQKIAAVTVAISLTIATADTFRVAKRQYEEGFMDSDKIVKEVVRGLEIRISQVVSDTFIWLAQVQTLIRLFPRHKEKVTIKWLGFGLILFDVIFSSLNNFLGPQRATRPLKYRDPIPALSYLFELAIGFIYASCIIYYSISKYRFAFYHTKMRNICLVALLSITSVLIPVVFFVLDVSSPDIATWGFYIRWVGAAAASVVVWEWVERIEALERDESKDGILGREIYDGDEMLDASMANGVDWPGRRSRRDSDRSHDDSHLFGWKDSSRERNGPLRARIPFHSRKKKRDSATGMPTNTAIRRSTPEQNRSGHDPPATVATPGSAASTVYAVRYHNSPSSSTRASEDAPYGPVAPKDESNEPTSEDTGHRENDNGNEVPAKASVVHGKPFSIPMAKPVPHQLWTAVSNPFKRKRSSPPAEVAGAQMLEGNSTRRSPANLVNSDRWNLKSKMDAFTTIQLDKLRAHRQSGKSDDPLPVTIIPAQPRGTRTWSPYDLPETSARSNHDSAHAHGRRLHTPVQPPTSGDAMNITGVPALIAREQGPSPEDARHGGWLQLGRGQQNLSTRQQEEGVERGMFSADETSAERYQNIHPRRFLVGTLANGSQVSRVGALTFTEPVPHEHLKPPSNGADVDNPSTQTANSPTHDVPSISSQQQQHHHQQSRTITPRYVSNDGQALPEVSPQTTPSSSSENAYEAPDPELNTRRDDRSSPPDK